MLLGLDFGGRGAVPPSSESGRAAAPLAPAAYGVVEILTPVMSNFLRILVLFCYP